MVLGCSPDRAHPLTGCALNNRGEGDGNTAGSSPQALAVAFAVLSLAHPVNGQDECALRVGSGSESRQTFGHLSNYKFLPIFFCSRAI